MAQRRNDTAKFSARPAAAMEANKKDDSTGGAHRAFANAARSILSPTSNVRRSCRNLLSDDPSAPDLDGAVVGDDAKGESSSNFIPGRRCVGIDSNALLNLAAEIGQSVVDRRRRRRCRRRNEQSAGHGENEGQASQQEGEGTVGVVTDATNADVADWDADGWHYTGSSYRRSNAASPMGLERRRRERVALYVLTLDAINFCFWPTDADEVGGDVGGEDGSAAVLVKKNLLEYEHLAVALRKVAEADDQLPDDEAHDGGDKEEVSEGPVRAEPTYALSPSNLLQMSPSRLNSLLTVHFPPNPANPTNDGAYLLPNLAERSRLLNELGAGLLLHHAGSATSMIESSNRSADALVGILLDAFPGFRDAAIDESGRQVFFYKRAQIAVADLWAALGRSGGGGLGSNDGSDVVVDDGKNNPCRFRDIKRLTTFADYRVPQLLRQTGVLRYDAVLTRTVDDCVELTPGSREELYIRAATVVAVDMLADAVEETVRGAEDGGRDGEDGEDDDDDDNDGVSPVTVDWHLWQVGERLDREGSLKPHHRVRTIFY